MEQKSKILNILEKNNVSRGTHAKKRSLAHHLACHCKKIIVYGGYFCCFFCFTWNQPGFLALYCVFFGNFKPPKHMFACFFGLFHVKHRVFSSVLCNFFDCRLVFIYFCCVFGLIWLIINGFCCFFLVSRETCRFHSRFLLFCGNFCSLCCVFLFRLVYLGLFFGIKWILLRFCF